MKVETDSTIDVLSYKPKMKALDSIDELPIDSETITMAKADGEFNLLIYDRDGETFTINRWGRKLSNFPALNELELVLSKTDGMRKAQLLVELYAMENGRPLMLPKYIHYLKGHVSGGLEKIFIGIWDVLRINGVEIKEPFTWKLEEVGSWVKDCRWVHVLPWRRTSTPAEVKHCWEYLVEEIGYEGLVVRNRRDIYKIKPLLEMDVVIIGINKRELLKKGKVTSLKLGLLRDDMLFVEVGDVASGINHDLRDALGRLMEYQVGEDRDTIYVKPMVVCTIQFNDIYEETDNRIYKFGACDKAEIEAHGQPIFEEKGKQKLIKLRHPKLAGFRSDKIVSLHDVGLNQIPESVRANGLRN
jgi:hypothetical protein